MRSPLIVRSPIATRRPLIVRSPIATRRPLMKLAFPLIMGALALAEFAGSAGAHHSFAMFDRSKTVVLDGTIKSIQLTNPHAWIVMTVAATDGALVDWSIEGPSPNMLIRLGWKRADVNAGDKVMLTANPTKDGSPGGVLVSVRLPGGRELSGVVPPGGVVPADASK